ncbi:hypothetical protein BMS81_10175, partial [Leuconostoc pseudomesenteroides]
MKTLVTGGNGFVAGHIIQKLLAQGDHVIATVRSDEKGQRLMKEFDSDHRLSYVLSSLNDPDDVVLTDALRTIDVLYHVASPLGGRNANDPNLIHQATGMVQAVFDSAYKAGVKRIVMTSSLAASTPEASTKGLIDAEFWSDEENPELNAYRLSKLSAEKLAWNLADKYHFQLSTILPGAIFGPTLTDAISSNGLIAQIIHGTPLPKISLEISDVRDVAEIHILAASFSQFAVGQRFIAKNGDLTFVEVAKTLKPEFPRVKLSVLPDFVVRLVAKFQPSIRALVPMLGR